MRVVECDGSVASALLVAEALAEALAGGPAVLPVPDAPAAERDRLIAAARPELGSAAAVLVATSGSSGEVKLVELPAVALFASAEATHERLGGPGGWLLALPVRHIAGLQVLVRSIVAGTEPAVLDLRGGFRPDAFAAAARDLLSHACGDLPNHASGDTSSVSSGDVAGFAPGSRRRYTALVPTQLVRLLQVGGPALDALRGFDAVLIGGAATPAELVAGARAAGVRIVTTYGMTETAGGCVYDGRPLRGVRVRLDGERRIHLGGPTLAAGYRLRPDLTASAFAGGWFRSGDVGRLIPDGTLEVHGRVDDVIVTGGRKVAAVVVERALDASPDIAESCVVGLPDPGWGELVAAAVVPSPGAAPDLDALRAGVREVAGREAVPKFVAILDELPRRGIGKIDRDAVRRHLAERHAHRVGSGAPRRADAEPGDPVPGIPAG